MMTQRLLPCSRPETLSATVRRLFDSELNMPWCGFAASGRQAPICALTLSQNRHRRAPDGE
jgi:hypothetical protein